MKDAAYSGDWLVSRAAQWSVRPVLNSVHEAVVCVIMVFPDFAGTYLDLIFGSSLWQSKTRFHGTQARDTRVLEASAVCH